MINALRTWLNRRYAPYSRPKPQATVRRIVTYEEREYVGPDGVVYTTRIRRSSFDESSVYRASLPTLDVEAGEQNEMQTDVTSEPAPEPQLQQPSDTRQEDADSEMSGGHGPTNEEQVVSEAGTQVPHLLNPLQSLPAKTFFNDNAHTQGTTATESNPCSTSQISTSPKSRPAPRHRHLPLRMIRGQGLGIRHEHKIRGQRLYTRWFYTCGENALDVPPSPPELFVEVGNLYLHQSRRGLQIWCFTFAGSWKRVVPGDHHPELPDHRLSILPKGGSGGPEPRWITKKSFVTTRLKVNKWALELSVQSA